MLSAADWRLTPLKPPTTLAPNNGQDQTEQSLGMEENTILIPRGMRAWQLLGLVRTSSRTEVGQFGRKERGLKRGLLSHPFLESDLPTFHRRDVI